MCSFFQTYSIKGLFSLLFFFFRIIPPLYTRHPFNRAMARCNYFQMQKYIFPSPLLHSHRGDQSSCSYAVASFFCFFPSTYLPREVKQAGTRAERNAEKKCIPHLTLGVCFLFCATRTLLFFCYTHCIV